LEVLGPAPAALSLLRGRHRRRFLVKGRRGAELQGPLWNWLAAVKPGRAVRVQVDSDPQSFL
jgi:primosomal protein N' (replication factor Y)